MWQPAYPNDSPETMSEAMRLRKTPQLRDIPIGTGATGQRTEIRLHGHDRGPGRPLLGRADRNGR